MDRIGDKNAWKRILLADFLGPSADESRGQSSGSTISSMILSNDTAKLQQYHSIFMQSLPAYVLDHVGTRQKALMKSSTELYDTLEPLIRQLSIAATARKPYKTNADWREKLQDATYQLIGQALIIKQKTAANSEYTFRSIWAEHGIPVDHGIVFAKAPSIVEIPLVVLTTLVTGLSYQRNDQEGWGTLPPAEILEKIYND